MNLNKLVITLMLSVSLALILNSFNSKSIYNELPKKETNADKDSTQLSE